MVSVDVKHYVYLLTETRKRIRDGEPKTTTSTFTLLLSIFLMMTCCFTSTETVGLLGTGAQDGHLDFQTQLLSSEHLSVGAKAYM